MIAIVTTINSIFNTLKSPLAITLSIKNFVDPGSTRPASLLTTIRIRPTNKSFFRGQIIVLKTWLMVILDLGIVLVKTSKVSKN